MDPLQAIADAEPAEARNADSAPAAAAWLRHPTAHREHNTLAECLRSLAAEPPWDGPDEEPKP